MPMSPKDAPKQAMFVMSSSSSSSLAVCGASKRCLYRSFARILLPIVHLLHELLRLFLVDEGQSCETFLELKGMEEGPILVIVPCVVDLLIPYNSSVSRL